jgi:DNA-binding XRE family transcriptional regulator
MHRRQSYVKEWLPIIDASEGSGLSDVAVRFGLRLREVRQDRGISQEKLAELAGLHRTYVSSVELEIVPIVVENRGGSSRTLSHYSVLASNPLLPDEGF